jgi:hypothetical protein
MFNARLLSTVLTVAAAASWPASRAQACAGPQFGLFGRTPFPAAAVVGVPLNVRPVIRYALSDGYTVSVADVGDAGIGTEVELRKKGGAAVAVARTVLNNPSSPLGDVVVLLQPTAPLEPSTEYELVDRRPTIPCYQQPFPSTMPQCQFGPAAPFASFTTGTAADTSAPQLPMAGTLRHAGEFGGNPFVNCGIETSLGGGTCCGGPYVTRDYQASWPASTEPGGALYDLIEQGSGKTVAGLLDVTKLYLTVACRTFPGSRVPGLAVRPGRYQVRAVDWAGNQGPAVDVGEIPADVCANAPTLTGGSPVDALPDAPGADAPTDVSPGQTPDAAVDMVLSPAPSAGGCSVAGGASSPWLLVGVGLWMLRRRRDRSHS